MRTLIVLALAASAFGAEKLKEYKPGFNMFSAAQDVELGKEAAAEVRKTMPVINNSDLNGYLNQIGARLVKSKRAGAYPYSFEVVNDPSINAFALPGGPMFVHTGLIAAADNESQIAGVLAHEIAHVALRHGTSNVTKANMIQLPAMLAGALLGDKGGIWGTLGQLGIGLGAQSMLLKYSRDAEKNADLHGAQIMNDAGYDPTEMARFFDKLGAEGQRDDSKLANFMSDHPTPGNRVKYVQDQNKLLPKVQYRENDPGGLPRIKQVVAGLPAPPKPIQQAVGQGGQPGQAGGQGADPRPSGKYKQHQGSEFQLQYPDNWEVFGDSNSASVTIAPRSALVQGQNGQVEIGYGMLTSYYAPKDGKVNLQRDTNALIQQMGTGSQVKPTGKSKSVKVAGQNALLTPMESPSPFQNQREIDMVLTVARPEALFYIVFIAPESEWASSQKTFDYIVNSLQFANR